jgi:hypothetical protein
LDLLPVRGRATGVLVATLTLLGLWAGALAGPASAATAKNCGSWHSPGGNVASDIIASGVSCHYAKSKFLRAFNNKGYVSGWKLKYHSVRMSHGYQYEKVVATKGSDKITYQWKSVLG